MHNQEHLNRAMNYIVENMTRTLSLEEVASIAGFSKYHFHRIFKEFTGETLAVFMKRIRLEHAAFLLVYDKHRTVNDVALSAGFQSAQSFATAFKNYYKQTPTEYKKILGCRGMNILEPQSIQLSHSSTIGQDYAVRIQYLEGFDILYERSIEPYTNEGVLRHREDVLKADRERTYIGIAWDNPKSTPAQLCRYDFGYICEDSSKHKTKSLQHIESKTYAVLSTTLNNKQSTVYWEYLYESWLPRHGYKPDAFFCFERIYKDEISFYLPIKRI